MVEAVSLDEVMGLSLQRELPESVLRRLFHQEKTRPVCLRDFRFQEKKKSQQKNEESEWKQSVGMVIFGRGRRSSSTGDIYYVTDLRGMTASLELLEDAKRKFRGAHTSQLCGTLIYVIDPAAMIDPQREDSLLFQTRRQQDIIIAGKCPSFGKCEGLRRDGKECSMPIDTDETTRCKYHPLHRDSISANLNSFKQKGPLSQGKKNLAHKDTSESPVAVSKTGADLSMYSNSGDTIPSSEIDILQQALKADPDSKSSEPSIVRREICSAFVDEDKEGSLNPNQLKIMPDTSITARNYAVRKENSPTHVDIDRRKDGSVAVPKESHVFKRLSEKFYDNLAKRNQSISMSAALKQVSTPIPSDPNVLSSCGLLKSRHNATVKSKDAFNHIDAVTREKNQKFSRLQSFGGDLVDLDEVRKNAKVSSKRKGDGIKFEQNKKKKLDMEIEALLKQESSHKDEADSDAFKAQMSRLDSLSKREYVVQKEEKVQKMTVKAHHCLTCGEMSEQVKDICRRNKHNVNTISVTKRFYECGACEHRDSTLGSNVRLPKHSCMRCGEYKWRPCGKRKTSHDTTSRASQSEKLVVSMSADTAKCDITRLAAAKSALDQSY